MKRANQTKHDATAEKAKCEAKKKVITPGDAFAKKLQGQEALINHYASELEHAKKGRLNMFHDAMKAGDASVVAVFLAKFPQQWKDVINSGNDRVFTPERHCMAT